MRAVDELGVDPGVRRVRLEVGISLVTSWLAPLGADAGYVGTVSEDGETLEVGRVTPYARQPVWLTFPLEAPYPLAVAVRERRPVFIADCEQLGCDHPGLVQVDGEDHACATLPIVAADGELLGAVNFAFEEPHYFTEKELELITIIGQRCAEMMDVARHAETEVLKSIRGPVDRPPA